MGPSSRKQAQLACAENMKTIIMMIMFAIVLSTYAIPEMSEAPQVPEEESTMPSSFQASYDAEDDNSDEQMRESMDAQPKQPMRPTSVERSAEQHLQLALQKQKGKKVDDCIKMAKTAYDGVVKQLKTLQKKINALDGGESCANKKTAELRRICRCCVLKDTKDVEDVAFAEQKVSVESVVTDTITICVAKKNAAGKSTKDCSTKRFVKKLRSDTYKKLAITRKTLAPGVEGTLCGKKEKEAKEKAPKEKVDKESKTKEKKTKEGGDKEKYKKEGLTKESKSKEGRVKEQTDKEKASKELKRKETNAKEKKTKYE